MNNDVLLPHPWGGGGGVGVFHMSSAKALAFPERFSRGCSNLCKSLDAQVHRQALNPPRAGYLPSSPAETADAFHRLVATPNTKVLVSSIGGFNSNSVLPFIDWELVRSHRKLICGYSDTSALLLAAYKKSRLSTIHGPAVMPHWGAVDGILPRTLDTFRKAAEQSRIGYLLEYPGYWIDPRSDWTPGRETLITAKRRRDEPWRAVRTGTATGTILGGNVETINMMVGTSFLPSFAGAIAFIEANGPEAYLPRFHRALVHLRDSGVLADISGLIVGRLLSQDEYPGVTVADVLQDVFGAATFPIVVDVDLGHTEPMISLPLGATGVLSATKARVALQINWNTW